MCAPVRARPPPLASESWTNSGCTNSASLPLSGGGGGGGGGQEQTTRTEKASSKRAHVPAVSRARPSLALQEDGILYESPPQKEQAGVSSAFRTQVVHLPGPKEGAGRQAEQLRKPDRAVLRLRAKRFADEPAFDVKCRAVAEEGQGGDGQREEQQQQQQVDG